MESRVRPDWLVAAGLILTIAAAFCFSRGWLAGARSADRPTPLDLVAARLASLRLQPLPPRHLSRRMLWPAAGLALLALGWEQHHGRWLGRLVCGADDGGFRRGRAD
jgi:hypothetical protein